MAWLQWTSSRTVWTVVAGAAGAALTYVIYRFLGGVYHPDDEYFETLTYDVINPPKRRILVIGLDGSGKTSLIQCFGKGNKDGKAYGQPRSTVGFNVKSINMGEAVFDFWDVGGSEMCRLYWKQFKDNVHTILWVVDSADEERMQESRNALIEFIREEEEGIPLIIVANKQDKEGAMKPKDVLKRLDVSTSTAFNARRIEMVGVQVPQGGERKGVWATYKQIIEMSK